MKPASRACTRATKLLHMRIPAHATPAHRQCNQPFLVCMTQGHSRTWPQGISPCTGRLSAGRSHASSLRTQFGPPNLSTGAHSSTNQTLAAEGTLLDVTPASSHTKQSCPAAADALCRHNAAEAPDSSDRLGVAMQATHWRQTMLPNPMIRIMGHARIAQPSVDTAAASQQQQEGLASHSRQTDSVGSKQADTAGL